MKAADVLPLITVVTPVFNGERFIRSCIENVARQDYPRTRHIIVDGASTDRTVSIVEELRRKHGHITLISEKDRGQSDAINKGIRAAKSQYVGILNVDDFYQPGVLARVGQIIGSLQEPSFIAANCNIWDENGELLHVNKPRHLEIEKLLLGGRYYPYPCNPAAYFYPKRLHDIAGFYDIHDHYAMDLRFILAAVQHIKALYVDEVWGNFRLIPGTKTFEDRRRGTARQRKRKVYVGAFLRAPLRTQMQVAPRWVLYRLFKKLGLK